ncbi:MULTISPECIES: hypothetical protein [unclassified Pseudoalteromonas]|uniref:hypothetical protein n=1 Tax=Pseudoalteromonas sp. RB2-MNA-CIBAN-0110 TaxID=3140439 RepID=UPI00042106BA|nr:hypothetical protein [Pseudoalteromonas sp. TB13]
MFENLSLGKRLGSSYFILITILLIMTGFAVVEMRTISSFTQQLYKHPYTVSVSIAKIEVNVTSIHSAMKDVAQANTIEQINDAAKEIARLEKTR